MVWILARVQDALQSLWEPRRRENPLTVAPDVAPAGYLAEKLHNISHYHPARNSLIASSRSNM
jgi:hypothetical protein